MSPKLTIFVFAALLLVARAHPVSEDIQSSDNVDDVIEEAERSDDKVDLTELKDEDFREIVKYVQENLKRAVDEMNVDQAEMADEKNLEKRFLKNWNVGGGWSAGTSGLSWQNRRGNMHFNVKPTFGNGLGFRSGFTWKF